MDGIMLCAGQVVNVHGRSPQGQTTPNHVEKPQIYGGFFRKT